MAKKDKKICGIVMPISAVDGCSESHWSDVLEILSEAIESAGFEGDLVSNSDDVGIIHKRIIQNLYENPIVVCDVSGKNPNVMFELGMRLAFDKPTIIVKDIETAYSFDTSSIEHLEYPRDLRFTKIVEFKKKLAEKITATYQKSESDPNYTTFLKHFGEFKVAKIDKKEVSGQEFIIEELKNMRKVISRMERNKGNRPEYEHFYGQNDIDICLDDVTEKNINEAFTFMKEHPGVKNVGMAEMGSDHYHLTANVDSHMEGIEIESKAYEILEKNKKNS